MRQVSNDLWAITSYFNPVGYQSRLTNYRTFRKHLASPLLTIELSYSSEFELGASDATRLIQLRTDQILWQKECLLNLGIAKLPSEVRFVAWLDCDIVFQRSDWVGKARDALQENVLIQPYTIAYDLDRDVEPTEVRPDQAILARQSMASKYVSQAIDFNKISTNSLSQYSPGHAWVIRRDAVKKVGLYDAMILGSGDLAIAMAAIGRFEDIVRTYEMNPVQAKHYIGWAREFHKRVDGSVGVIDGKLYHLWHGDLEDRGYSHRYSSLKRFDFDPFNDIAMDKSGFWRWASDKVDLHRYVRSYFQSRNENGHSRRRSNCLH